MSKGTGGALDRGTKKHVKKTRVQSLGGLQEHDALWEQVISMFTGRKKGDVWRTGNWAWTSARSCHNKELRLYHTGDGGERQKPWKVLTKERAGIRFICSSFQSRHIYRVSSKSKALFKEFGIYWWTKFCLHGTQMPMAESTAAARGPGLEGTGWDEKQRKQGGGYCNSRDE